MLSLSFDLGRSALKDPGTRSAIRAAKRFHRMLEAIVCWLAVYLACPQAWSPSPRVRWVHTRGRIFHGVPFVMLHKV
jgi:hypothetical protein